jgi:hypothetical protein
MSKEWRSRMAHFRAHSDLGGGSRLGAARGRGAGAETRGRRRRSTDTGAVQMWWSALLRASEP